LVPDLGVVECQRAPVHDFGVESMQRDRANRLGGYANYLSQGSDPKHYPFAPDRILVWPTAVLLRQLIDVVAGLRSLHLLYHFPAHLNKAVGIILVPDQERDPRIALDVAKLLAVHLGVDQEVSVISIDPHHLGLRVAVWHQRCNRREVLCTGQLEDGGMKFIIIRFIRHALVSSLGWLVKVKGLWADSDL